MNNKNNNQNDIFNMWFNESERENKGRQEPKPEPKEEKYSDFPDFPITHSANTDFLNFESTSEENTEKPMENTGKKDDFRFFGSDDVTPDEDISQKPLQEETKTDAYGMPLVLPSKKAVRRIEKFDKNSKDPDEDDFGEPESFSSKENTKSILKRIGIVTLLLIFAFTGAFSGMVWVCNSAIIGDSEFFQSLILKNSGVKVDRVEVDQISGNYVSDTTELAEKILKTTVEVKIYNYDEVKNIYTEKSNGSGVIMSADGYIITNNHVAEGAKHIKVVLSTGKSYDAKVVHLDEQTDLGIIKIEPDIPLTPVTFADSSKVVFGQEIAACGNPMGIGISVSFGYISSPTRIVNGEEGKYIQIDCSVNPGNSGGGLYDSQGNLLGIVSAKASGQNVDGIGFAVPSNRVLTVVNDLMKFGYVKNRPALGITIVNVTVSTWEHFNQNELSGYLGDRKYGVYIIDSKYCKQIQKGDIIKSINGDDVMLNTELIQIVSKCKVGEEVTLEIERPERHQDGSFTYSEFEVKFELRERDWADKLPYEQP